MLSVRESGGAGQESWCEAALTAAGWEEDRSIQWEQPP